MSLKQTPLTSEGLHTKLQVESGRYDRESNFCHSSKKQVSGIFVRNDNYTQKFRLTSFFKIALRGLRDKT